MREEGHRILRKKLSDPAPYQRRWNAHGEGPQVGGEGRSKPSALRRLSHLFSFFRATKRVAAEKQYVWWTFCALSTSRMAPGAAREGSWNEEWCLGRRLQKDEASEDDGGANWRESESQRSGDHL